MTRLFNGKAIVDEIGARLWDTSTGFHARILPWTSEIQDDLAGQLPMDYYKFKLKKLLPTEQEIIDLSPQIPSAATAAIAAGGSLVDGTSYKVYTTFVIWDQDTRDYMESEPSEASGVVTGTATNKTINLTAIDTFDGDTAYQPSTIYRRIYVAKLASGGSAYGEPLYYGQITNNTATTSTITSEPTSTITPPSDSEVDQITSDHMFFETNNRRLHKRDGNLLRRYDPNSTTTTTPDAFDFVGPRKIQLYPKLSTSASTAQRTLTYWVYRRPHEVFYDVDREIDLPIGLKKALVEGVTWKGYSHRDRDKAQTYLNNYEQFKAEALRKMGRQRGRPSSVRDVNGGTFGEAI